MKEIKIVKYNKEVKKRMNKTIGIMALMTLLVAGIAFATPTLSIGIYEPSEAGAVTYLGDSTSAKWQVNMTVTDTSPALVTCTLKAGSTLTANTSEYMNRTLNYTQNATMFNWTIRVDELEDADNYIFSVSCNSTIGFPSNYTDTLTGITIDNQKPSNATSLSPATATVDQDGKVIFSATVNASTTTGCSVGFSTAGKAHAKVLMSHSGSTCTSGTVRLSQAKGEPYHWYVVTDDGTNYTSSLPVILKVDTQSNLPARAWAVQQQQGTAGSSNTVGWIIVGVVVWLLWKNQKPKGRQKK